MLGPLRAGADHTASYADPIAVSAGEVLILTGRQDVWDGHLWLWARAADGREGWVPDALIAGIGAQAHAIEAYNAIELSCRAGDQLTGLRALNGWVWCRTAAGQEGWLPQRVLSPA